MARKSQPSILQEELYPPSAHVRGEHVRDDLFSPQIDDARLIDLDVDEEPPFLRGQKRVSARRSSLPKKTANRLLWGAAAAASVCVMGLAAVWLYHYGERSWRFRVESSDNIEVLGTQNVTKAQIMEVMGADIGRNIFFIPLALQKTQLEQIPWVESASVMRFVPNRLQVLIHERTPVAFARVGPRILLIDAGGTLMELPAKRKYSFPVILGMNLGEPLSTRAPRMKVYMQLLRELDGGGSRYSQDLSEVDLSDLDDVKVRVNDPAGDVLVHLGSSDFLARYKVYMTHAQAWRQQFQKLESVNLRYENQVIVNPDVGPNVSLGPKQVTLSPAAAKAAAAAGVKPAALISRLPGGRVPKPAFELSDKTLKSDATRKLAKTKAAKGHTGKRAKTTVMAKKFSPAQEGGMRTIESRRNLPVLHAAGGASSPGLKANPASGVLQKAAAGQKPSPAIKDKDRDKDGSRNQSGQGPSQ